MPLACTASLICAHPSHSSTSGPTTSVSGRMYSAVANSPTQMPSIDDHVGPLAGAEVEGQLLL